MVNQARCFVIAEAGVNHNGSLDLAMKLVEGAAAAGADAVKFQTFTADALVGGGIDKASYQQEATGSGDQRSMLKALELGWREHQVLHARCAELGIEFMSTPFDERSLEFLLDLGIERVKIASGELTNAPFLRRIASTGLPMILSTGMGTMPEIREALQWLEEARSGARGATTLLHCTSNYPAQFGDVNVLAIRSMAEEFALPVGYSDHTSGILIAPVAVALGAKVIEKHFTLDRNLLGPDHAASLSLDELKTMVRDIRLVESALGNGVKAPSASELPVRALVRRSVAASVDLQAGHQLRREDLTTMRPETGIAPKYIDSVVGRVLRRRITAGEVLQAADLV